MLMFRPFGHFLLTLVLLLSSAASTAQASATNGSAADSASSSPALAVRISQHLHAVPGLELIQASEHGGVVRLEGSVVKTDNRDTAEAIAKSYDGVIAVQNRIRLSPSIQQRLDLAWRDGLEQGWRFILFLPLLAVALLVVWAFSRAGRWLSHRPWLHLRGANPFLDSVAKRLLQWVFTLAGVLIALDLLGATSLAGALMGSAGLMGLAVGFAFRDIVENYLAGILLSLRRPFAPRDYVRIDSYEGKVIALTSRSTVLMTLEGVELQLPNAMVFKAVILNYSRNDLRRFDFFLSIANGDSIRQAQTLALAEITTVHGVLSDPAPTWWVEEETSTGSKLRFLAWVNQTEHDYLKVRSECIRRIKLSYSEHGIAKPTNTYNIVNKQPDTPKATALDKQPQTNTQADTTLDQQINAYEAKHGDPETAAAKLTP